MVSDSAALWRAIQSAEGGELILLSDGYYGQLNLKNSAPEEIVIKALNSGESIFEELIIFGSENLSFENIRVTKRFEIGNNANNIKLRNSTISGILYVKYAKNITVENNTINGVFHASIFNDVQHFSIRNNVIRDAQEDLMRITGNSFDGIVENNFFWDMHPEDNRDKGKGYNHSDAIQMFGTKGFTPRDIIIRGNHIFDNRATGAPKVTPQGIFLSDPAGDGGYRNILVEDNLINVSSMNSIYINGGQHNVIVRNNTLIPSQNDGGAVIRLAEKSGYDNAGTVVLDNVAKIIKDETKSSVVRHNYVYGRNANLKYLFLGDGDYWEDFIPVSGSPIDFGTNYGAFGRLLELKESIK